jgi:hypothetical protein
MPTVYRFAKKSLQRNNVDPRDMEIWLKHCEQKGIDPSTTAPVAKHPNRRKKP